MDSNHLNNVLPHRRINLKTVPRFTTKYWKIMPKLEINYNNKITIKIVLQSISHRTSIMMY